MLELILLAQYKTIIKMIKILSCRRIVFKDGFFRLKQLFCDSVGKSGGEVEFLKHSRFSHFMGLSTEMKNLSKKQQQNQKQEMRQAQLFSILALIGFACFTIFLYYNEQFTFRVQMIVKRISENLGKTSVQKKQSTFNLLIEIQKYLMSNPYEYKAIIDSIFVTLCSLPIQGQNEQIYIKIQQIYLRILDHNFKAATSEILKDGLQKLVQRSYLSKRRISTKIAEVLLSQGSIKQYYLTVKYLQMMNDTNWILLSDLKLKLISNYQRNQERNKKYFELIFSNVDEQKLPVFSSYKKMQQLRLSYLQNFLKQSVS